MGPIASRRSHGRRRTAIIICEFMGPVTTPCFRVASAPVKRPREIYRIQQFNQRNNCDSWNLVNCLDTAIWCIRFSVDMWIFVCISHINQKQTKLETECLFLLFPVQTPNFTILNGIHDLLSNKNTLYKVFLSISRNYRRIWNKRK